MIRARWLSGAAYAGMFGFGIVMAILGAILPLISQRLHLDLARAGDLFGVMNAAMLVTTLALGPVLDRHGMKAAFVIAPLSVAAALVWIASAATFSALLTAVALLGAGGGALNQSTNTLIADLHGDARRKNAALNLLGVFFGFGALFIPFAIGSMLGAVGLSSILAIAALLVILPALLSLVQRFPKPRQARGIPFAVVLNFLKQPLILLFSFLLFFESGNEFLLGGYLTTFLTRNRGAAVETASYLLAAYWGAIMLARIVLSRVLLKISGALLIGASALGVAASTGLLLGASSLAAAGIAVVLLGLSIAAIFPTTLGLAGARYPDHAGTVFGILIGIALVGGMTVPWVAGRVARASGAGAALAMAIASALAIFLLQLAAQQCLKKDAPARC